MFLFLFLDIFVKVSVDTNEVLLLTNQCFQLFWMKEKMNEI
jgi:hypothetical protein